MPFKPGNNANPGGRPKASTDVRLSATLLLPKAFKALEKCLSRPGERISAIQIIFDRSVGKVPTTANVRVIADIADLSDAELLAITGETKDLINQQVIEQETDNETSSQ
jgi:hypothetical protein